MTLSNTLSIFAYLHCGKCIAERPPNVSARDWAQLEVGWTKPGLQVWCRRHECNIMHVDFEGNQHPANLTVADAPPPGPIEHGMKNFIMLEKTSDGKARCLLIEQDDEGFRSVQDIIESDYVWWAIYPLVGSPGDKLYCETEQDRILKDISDLLCFKTLDARIKNVLRVLEERYKTGLDLSKPKSPPSSWNGEKK